MSEKREYKRLSCAAFGEELLTSMDLDPVYVAVARAPMNNAQRSRLLVAYWCLYHLGAAARLSELPEKRFWWALFEAAANNNTPKLLPKQAGGRWPRGTERRHWRGDQAINSAASVRERARGNAEALVDWLGTGATFLEVLRRVRQLQGFGPWIGFKVADMLERVAGYDVSFADCELAFYEEPRKGAALYVGSVKLKHDGDNYVDVAVKHLLHEARLGAFRAPPILQGSRRRVNVQEVETVLCKWKSHLGGHYPVGKDTREIYHGLDGWGDLAQDLRITVGKLKHAPNQPRRR